MSAETAYRYRKKLEIFEKNKGHVISGIDRHKSHLLFHWVYEIVRNKNILDAVEDLLGQNILCWSSNFFIKEKNTVTVEVKEVGDTKQLVFNSAQSNEPELAGVGDETSDS